jgi:Protein of unknown function (DUF1003)
MFHVSVRFEFVWYFNSRSRVFYFATAWTISVKALGFYGVFPYLTMFAGPIIMMSQNGQSRFIEHRNQLDLQINLLGEQENTEMLRLLRMLCEKAGIPGDQLSSTELLSEETKPVMSENSNEAQNIGIAVLASLPHGAIADKMLVVPARSKDDCAMNPILLKNSAEIILRIEP